MCGDHLGVVDKGVMTQWGTRPMRHGMRPWNSGLGFSTVDVWILGIGRFRVPAPPGVFEAVDRYRYSTEYRAPRARSAPGSSRGCACVRLWVRMVCEGLRDGCEVRLCDPCVRASRVCRVPRLWECGGRGVCVRVNVRCVWLRSCAAVLRVIVCLSSLCVGSGSRVCPVRG